MVFVTIEQMRWTVFSIVSNVSGFFFSFRGIKRWISTGKKNNSSKRQEVIYPTHG